MHSYSQLILRPFAHISSVSPDEAKIKQVSDEMASIIQAVHGTRFTPGTWYTALYPSSGVSQDWHYAYEPFCPFLKEEEFPHFSCRLSK